MNQKYISYKNYLELEQATQQKEKSLKSRLKSQRSTPYHKSPINILS